MARKSLAEHLRHIPAAAGYSLAGLKAAALTETAFIQEIVVLVCLPIAGWLIGVAPGQIILAVAGWLLVMAVELLNMAIEAVCNLVSPDFHPLVKVAKDAGSAAVFVLITANALYWLYLLYSLAF